MKITTATDTDTQFYLAIGMPMFVIALGIFTNAIQMNTMNARIGGVENRISSLEGTMNSRFIGLEVRFENLICKVIDIDNRLTRVEERLEHR